LISKTGRRDANTRERKQFYFAFRPSSDDIPVAILASQDKLSDRICRLIKEKFAGFNKEFEEIAKTQRSYSIPGKALFGLATKICLRLKIYKL
jgi:hypothetical protein